MSTLSVNDLLNKDTDDLIPQISKELEPNYKDIKKALEGAVPSDLLKTGNKIDVLNYQIQFTKMVNATGRAFFKVVGYDRQISVPFSFLTGEKEEFPYKNGDIVTLDVGEEVTIVGLIPSSKKVKVLYANGNTGVWHIKHIKI